MFFEIFFHQPIVATIGPSTAFALAISMPSGPNGLRNVLKGAKPPKCLNSYYHNIK